MTDPEQTGSDQDYSDATVYSRAGFDAPEPELENEPVICAGCGEPAPADKIGVHMDETVRSEDGELVHVKRGYVHNRERCLAAVMGLEEAVEAGDRDE